MKKLLASFLFSLAVVGTTQAQIKLTGDSQTEQAAKLELIRLLQERDNKLALAQMNSRIVVSVGVKKYYKVDEIFTMQKSMLAARSKYAALANQLEKPSAGLGSAGNFANSYINQYNVTVKAAEAIVGQLKTVTTSGEIIHMPPLPTFNISFASNSGGSNPANDLSQQMNNLMASFGVNSPEDLQNMDPAKKQEMEGKLMLMKEELYKQTIAKGNNNATKLMSLVANILMPGLGGILGGLTSGNNPINTLVGYINDNFQVPTDYYNSETLKLTDAERIEMIDELHERMSVLYQKSQALTEHMSNQSRKHFNETMDGRNEIILYGPKN